jgi:hypothetical protein
VLIRLRAGKETISGENGDAVHELKAMGSWALELTPWPETPSPGRVFDSSLR